MPGGRNGDAANSADVKGLIRDRPWLLPSVSTQSSQWVQCGGLVGSRSVLYTDRNRTGNLDIYKAFPSAISSFPQLRIHHAEKRLMMKACQMPSKRLPKRSPSVKSSSWSIQDPPGTSRQTQQLHQTRFSERARRRKRWSNVRLLVDSGGGKLSIGPTHRPGSDRKGSKQPRGRS